MYPTKIILRSWPITTTITIAILTYFFGTQIIIPSIVTVLVAIVGWFLLPIIYAYLKWIFAE